MSRIARVVTEGIPYHIAQRGNGKQRVFFEDRDYNLYQDLLQNNSEDAGLAIWAYCLMPNHIHLIVLPKHSSAMAKAVGRTHAEFARYFNLRQRSCGHVWQARYYSTPLDTVHLWSAMAYVERNPVRATLAARAQDYPWSSAHLRMTGSQGLADLAPWQAKYDWRQWREILDTSIDEEAFGQRLKEAGRCGRPLGSDQFIDDLEKRCGRRLRALPVGRPKKLGKNEESQLALGYGV